MPRHARRSLSPSANATAASQKGDVAAETVFVTKTGNKYDRAAPGSRFQRLVIAAIGLTNTKAVASILVAAVIPLVAARVTTAQTSDRPSSALRLDTRGSMGQVAQGDDMGSRGFSRINETPTEGTPLSASAGLTISPIFESTITTDPNAALIESAITAAIADVESKFADPITVTISFGAMDTGLGQSATYYYILPYNTFLAALKADAKTGDDTAALARLPLLSSNPVNGGSTINVRTANLKAVGFAVNPPVDGYIAVNTSLTNPGSPWTNGRYSLAAVIKHEIDEVLGLGSALPATLDTIRPEDLFRYDGSGARSFTTSSSARAFFSINGTTSLAEFNQQYADADFGDWRSNPLPPGTAPRVQDAFGTPGVNPQLGVELVALDVIGYDRVNVPTPPSISIESPGLGSTAVEPFTINGWALKRTSLSGPGIDAVQVYAYPRPGSGAPAIFLGTATYGLARADVGAANGPQFYNSGFQLSVRGLAPDRYRLVVYARDAASGVFTDYNWVDVNVVNSPAMGLYSPTNNSTVSSAFEVSGWAIDRASGAGPGVDAVHVYIFPNVGSGQPPVFIGAASYGWTRSDVGGMFGPQFTNSGFHFTLTGVGPGTHDLAVYSRSTVSGQFDNVIVNRITVNASKLMGIDLPSAETKVGTTFWTAGWAIDRSAASGTGVDAIHIYAYPDPGSGRPAVFLGVAAYGQSRPDVAAIYGGRYNNSAFALQVTTLTPGVYDIVMFAHSTATNTFDNWAVVRTDVRAAPPP